MLVYYYYHHFDVAFFCTISLPPSVNLHISFSYCTITNHDFQLTMLCRKEMGKLRSRKSLHSPLLYPGTHSFTQTEGWQTKKDEDERYGKLHGNHVTRPFSLSLLIQSSLHESVLRTLSQIHFHFLASRHFYGTAASAPHSLILIFRNRYSCLIGGMVFYMLYS